MPVFCCRIKGMLLTKVTDDGYVDEQTSMLQFSWNGAILRADVIHCSYVTQ